jgi:hypothetical protein
MSIMGAHTVISHALKEGARMYYTGTQSWGPRAVTVVEPWGGRQDPLYVVAPDGKHASTYVVSESELVPLGQGPSLAKATGAPVSGVVLATRQQEIRERGRAAQRAYRSGVSAAPASASVGVTLSKASDVACVVPQSLRMLRYLPSAWMLRKNDLDSLADWFALAPPRV